MSRVIYSLYIDIPEKDLDFFDKNIIKKGQTPTNINTKNKLKLHYNRLVECKRKYAKSIGADFKLFEYDSQFEHMQDLLQHTIWSMNIRYIYSMNLQTNMMKYCI